MITVQEFIALFCVGAACSVLAKDLKTGLIATLLFIVAFYLFGITR